MPDMDNMGGELDPAGPGVPRVLTPDICGARAWQITPDSKDLEVHVVPTSAGASVITVPTDGGAVRGFRVDNRGDLFDRDITTIREDRLYSHVQAAIVEDRLVLGSVTDDKVALDIIRDDLGARHDLGDVSGSFVAPVVQSRETQMALVGGAGGMIANNFSGALWQPSGTLTISKASIVSATAMTYHDDAIVAYSTTDHECHFDYIVTGRKSTMRDGCDNAQIAVDTTTGNGFMIYEQAGSEAAPEMASNKSVDKGEGLITGLPPLPANAPIDIVMNIDSEGLLEVKAAEPSSGRNLTIQVRISLLTEAEVVDARSAVALIAVRS